MNDQVNNKKKSNRILVLALLVIIGFTAGFIACLTILNKSDEPIIIEADDLIAGDNYMLTISTVEKIVKPANDLITSTYNYKDADVYENYKELFNKRVPFTTDKVVFTYKGTIGVGVDLSQVKYDIDNENTTISIELQEVGIKFNEIDESSFEYPFESNSIFNSTEMSDYTKLLATLKEKKEIEVKSDLEFMHTAKQNTENVLKNFLTASDETKDYSVIFE